MYIPHLSVEPSILDRLVVIVTHVQVTVIESDVPLHHTGQTVSNLTASRYRHRASGASAAWLAH